jgi:hypothetical protein
MYAIAVGGGGFLLAVLWFDLMFDVQVRKHADIVPSEILDSIASYYRRVTIAATPMNRLVSVVMIVVLCALVAEIVEHADPPWMGWGSLACAASAIGLAAVRTVRNAMKLGGGSGTVAERSKLARAIYRDHLFCLAAIGLLVGLQLAAR